MRNVRTKRGADVALDHCLVVAKTELKLKKTGQLEKQHYQSLIQSSFDSLTNSTDSGYISRKEKLLWKTTGMGLKKQ